MCRFSSSNLHSVCVCVCACCLFLCCSSFCSLIFVWMGGVWEAEWWNHCEGFVLLEGTRCEASEQKLGDGVWASALTAEEVSGWECPYVCMYTSRFYIQVCGRICTFMYLCSHRDSCFDAFNVTCSCALKHTHKQIHTYWTATGKHHSCSQ